MYDTVVVPTDGSDGTSKTLRHAFEMGRRYNARLHALSVVDERQFDQLRGESRYESQATLRDNCDRAVQNVRQQAESEGVPVETAIREGVPSQRIIEYSVEVGADVIVMGTHGRSAHERIATVGSVTQRVVENAEIPVFVVHIGRDTGWG